MNTHDLRPRKWMALTVAVLLVAGSMSLAEAQGRKLVTPDGTVTAPRPCRRPPDLVTRAQPGMKIRRALAQGLAVVGEPGEYPVVVLPSGQGFHELQAALDYCSTLPAGPAPNLVLLEAGTYTGNFILPQEGTTYVIGREGAVATIIEGAAGIDLPVLDYTPDTGAANKETLLVGVTVVGHLQAALSLHGSDSNARLALEDCTVVTDAAIPAIAMSGTGHDGNGRMVLTLWDSTIDSQGDGVAATSALTSRSSPPAASTPVRTRWWTSRPRPARRIRK